MVSPVPLIPQESRTLLSNQLAQGEFLKITKKQQSFRKEPFVMDVEIYSLSAGDTQASSLTQDLLASTFTIGRWGC
ncbi:hypothetical protein ACTWQL_20980 [Pseudalkalibacillus sp. R45]|uniref:hypothetical protein n=1 Tax=Pseudalkalibacillus sp. R45 TaxID=3457433 RepID=UPI003FCCBDD4